MNMAKTQDLPLNPSKVSGVCGRLLCCLSYENEQYRQMKTTMPRLGQQIETPAGPGMVVSMQILKDLVTVRLAADNTDQNFSGADLGLRRPEPEAVAPPRFVPPAAPVEQDIEAVAEETDGEEEAPEETAEAQRTGGRRRRRRGRGSRRRSDGQPDVQA
jgi:cell fate regulator YaaT (PSP1 superfamily)